MATRPRGERMGKGFAYLALTVIGALMLWATGQFDEVAGGTNLRKREAYWQAQVDDVALQGKSRAAVEAFAAAHHLMLQCEKTAVASPLTECLADDPQARGGTATHPMTLQLAFMLQGDTLHTFATSPRSLE